MEGARLLISDLDGTLLGNDAALERFADWHETVRGSVRLAYNSGRFFESVSELVASTPLPAPDAVIGGVGTDIRIFPYGERVDGWPRPLAPWRRRDILSALARYRELEPQRDEYQAEFKLSYYAPDLDCAFLVDLRRRLAASGQFVEIVYSSNRDLDVLPAGINKGSAASFLATCWGFTPERVIVAGDTGNDASMFARGFRGIVVDNGDAQLKCLRGADVYHSGEAHADGVLDGLEHWLSSDVGHVSNVPKTDKAR